MTSYPEGDARPGCAERFGKLMLRMAWSTTGQKGAISCRPRRLRRWRAGAAMQSFVRAAGPPSDWVTSVLAAFTGKPLSSFGTLTRPAKAGRFQGPQFTCTVWPLGDLARSLCFSTKSWPCDLDLHGGNYVRLRSSCSIGGRFGAGAVHAPVHARVHRPVYCPVYVYVARPHTLQVRVDGPLKRRLWTRLCLPAA